MIQLPNDIFFAHVESEISSGKNVLFKVKGNSMFPLLRNEIDQVLLSPVDCAPQKMDIILFRFRGKHILHRIIDVKDDKFIIQGDGVYASFEQCGLNDIVGKVTAIHKFGSKPISVSSKWYKFFSHFWFKLRFCRRYLLAILRRIYK